MSDEEWWSIIKVVSSVLIVGIVIGLLPNPYRVYLLFGIPGVASVLAYWITTRLDTAAIWYLGVIIALALPAGCVRQMGSGGNYQEDRPSCSVPRFCD